MRLNATFARALPGPGGLAIASQSGGVGFTLLDLARDLGVGVHSFVSLGAKLDVSSNDLLAAWMDDDQVTAAALHLESFGNALKFARTARRFAERKPLLCVLGGRSTGSAVGVDALFAQAGVIPCRSAIRGGRDRGAAAGSADADRLPGRRGHATREGWARWWRTLPTPRGSRCPELSSQGQATVQEAVPGAVRARNPVDLGADLSPSALEAGVRALLSLPELDAVVVVLVPTSLADPAGLFDALSRARAQSERPVLLVASDAAEHAQPGGVVVYRTAEAAVGALARTMRYAAWRRVPIEDPPATLRVRASPSPARGRSERLAARDGRAEWLPASASAELLGSYGIEHGRRTSRQRRGGRRAAAAIGFPVVVKVADPSIRHKTDRGLVRAGLLTPARGGRRDRRLPGRPGRRLGRRPRAARAAPASRWPAEWSATRCSVPWSGSPRVASRPRSGRTRSTWCRPSRSADVGRALRGLRCGRCSMATAAARRSTWRRLQSVLVGVGQLVVDVPQVSDLDLNPLLVAPDGVHCVDVKVRLQPSDALDAGIPRRLRSPS